AERSANLAHHLSVGAQASVSLHDSKCSERGTSVWEECESGNFLSQFARLSSVAHAQYQRSVSGDVRSHRSHQRRAPFRNHWKYLSVRVRRYFPAEPVDCEFER